MVVFNGAENTTIDVKVTVPIGWTSAACRRGSGPDPTEGDLLIRGCGPAT